jgi:hypothetical protein
MTENTEQETRELLREESMLPAPRPEDGPEGARNGLPPLDRGEAGAAISRLAAYLKMIDR